MEVFLKGLARLRRTSNGMKQAAKDCEGALKPKPLVQKFAYICTEDLKDIFSDLSRTTDRTVLMVRAQNGDSAAYRFLLEEITPYLRSLTAHWSKGGSDGEDILQEILLTLHSVRQTYDPSRSFEQWLVGVARHRVDN
ncbi:sigma factor [Bradyrhizobium sp. dw_411]|uniref:sigma factor n=1 Tax=Bradyrhizobium sp. dw_411 TaxID=2720082 RepID=UPI00201C3D14|nr:sigma factor [Bradyrhizobium sp. dw_411]